jgi:hypothetical protein
MHRQTPKSESGVTLVESLIAASMLTLFITGVFFMNGRNLQLLRYGKETFSATQVLDQRMEQLRGGKWEQVTDPNYIQTLMGTAPASGANFSSLTEEVVLSAYPVPSPAMPVTRVARSPSGTVTVISSNPLLRLEVGVRADIRATWTGAPGSRPRVRELSTIIANGGLISK